MTNIALSFALATLLSPQVMIFEALHFKFIVESLKEGDRWHAQFKDGN